MEGLIIREPDAKHCDSDGVPSGVSYACYELGKTVREILDEGHDYYGSVAAFFIRDLLKELRTKGRKKDASRLEGLITRGRDTNWGSMNDIAKTSKAMPWLRSRLPSTYLLLETSLAAVLFHDCLILPCEVKDKGGCLDPAVIGEPNVKIIYVTDSGSAEDTVEPKVSDIPGVLISSEVPRRVICSCLELERIADYVIMTLNMRYAAVVCKYVIDFLQRDIEWPEEALCGFRRISECPRVTAEDEIRFVKQVLPMMRKYFTCSYRDLMAVIAGRLYMDYAKQAC